MSTFAPDSVQSRRLPLELVDRLDQVCDRFDAEWCAGARPRIESYLAVESEPNRPLLLRELLAAELERRVKLGERPTAREYLDRFAGFGPLVAAMFEEIGLPAGGHVDDVLALKPVGERESESEASTLASGEHRAGRSGPLPEMPGYEIISELGRGGMGVVYQAREVRLNRIVALKMILAGVHSHPEAGIRFLNEAEVVARLRHPNIVQVYSLGDHEGRPYLELEYVEGGNLARSLDGTPRLAAGAAALVEVLARAVQEAHARGIIHRDLKPSNVLLTADGQPKIADFGLAKSLDSDSGLTRTDLVIGSPSYMAPEQADGRARTVGVAADVYALGAIFYELLTGRPPFRAATPLATLELVRNAFAVPPSRFRPDLPRDLETICLKCLEKQPERRYPTAIALAEDLRRSLEGRPITARPVGLAGRLARWCIREPKVASLVALLALVVACGFAGIAWAWRRAEAERTTAVVAMKKAEANFQKARAVVEDLGKAAERMWGRPEFEKSRREILEKVVNFHASFLEERSDDPNVIEQSAQAERKVAHVRQELGQDDRALQAFERSAALYDRLVAQSPDNPRLRSEQGWSVYHIGVFQLKRRQQLAKAQAAFEKAIAIMERLVAGFPNETGYRSALSHFLNNWAFVRMRAGDPDGAERALERAVALGRGVLAARPGNLEASRFLGLSLHDLSGLLLTRKELGEAEQASREAIALYRQTVDAQLEMHYLRPYLARAQDRLAMLLEQTGRISEALEWRQRGYDDLRALLRAFPDIVDYQSALARTAAEYGCLLHATGEVDRGAEACAIAIAQREKLAAVFPESAEHQNELGWARVALPVAALHRPGQAVRLATKAVALAPRNANYWNTLGVAQYRAGDLPASRTALEKAIALRNGESDVSDWLFLAMICWKTGAKPEAREWYDRAVREIEMKHRDDDETRRFWTEARDLLGAP